MQLSLKNITDIKFIIISTLLILLLLLIIFSPWIAPFDPYAQNLNNALLPPNSIHILGTDRYGRDLFSRILVGGQLTIFSSLLVVAIITIIGTIIGGICGYFGGKLDTILMRIADLFLAFPGIVFAIAVAGVLGGGIYNAIIALACISWPKYARLSRSQVLALKNTNFILAAKLSNNSPIQILYKHILPNILNPILITATLDIGTMIMELAGLSFLGLGATPPTAEWGLMMSSERSLLQTSPWVILSPGFAILITICLFNLFSDTLRDKLTIK